jgi:hypothetical protein
MTRGTARPDANRSERAWHAEVAQCFDHGFDGGDPSIICRL